MIKKVIRRDVLSGVSSPLLPLICADSEFGINETDGAYIQTDADDKLTAVFSLKNGCATLAKATALIDTDELKEFFLFLSVESCLSDSAAFGNCGKAFALLKCDTDKKSSVDVSRLNEYSRVGEYKAIYDLLNENSDNFPQWFTVTSKKINGQRAVAVYKCENNIPVSTAVATAVYGEDAVISGVYTLESCRGKGYASQCVSALLSVLSIRGVKSAYLWCEEDKIPFYEGLGFVKTGEVFREDF